MAEQNNISIVVPVYNEQDRIGGFLTDVVAYLKSKDFSYELLIVDDGSTDNTIALTDAFLRQHIPDNYKIHKLPRNRGKGGALQKGMLEARGDYIFFLDADGSTAISEIDNFIPYLDQQHDVYIAVRTIKHDAPFKRKFFGYGYIFLANFLLGMHIDDFTCGFKCYRREAARRIFARQTLNNWSFDAEDLFLAKKIGCSFQQIPVYWKHVGGSKVKVLNNIITCGWDLLRIRYNDMKGVYAER